MSTLSIVLLVILVVLIIACVVLYFLGKKAEKKQAEQQEQLDAVAQTVSMLIIDKGKMKLKDSGLPQIVIDNTPKYLRRSKVPVVKAKVGPRITTLMCDAQIYPLIPVKKEVKATVSGIYITGVKGVRGCFSQPLFYTHFLSFLFIRFYQNADIAVCGLVSINIQRISDLKFDALLFNLYIHTFRICAKKQISVWSLIWSHINLIGLKYHMRISNSAFCNI